MPTSMTGAGIVPSHQPGSALTTTAAGEEPRKDTPGTGAAAQEVGRDGGRANGGG